ncbi:hypothetical protein COJ27_06965 [Bacillus cereus]|nr:hypothetical protein COJ27_06965 [Bacillus cereus]
MKQHRMLFSMLVSLLLGILWEALFPFSYYELEYIDVFYFSIVRYGSITIILLVLLWIKKKKNSYLEDTSKLFLFLILMACTIYSMSILLRQMLMEEEIASLLASTIEVLMPLMSIVILWRCELNRFRIFTTCTAFIVTFLILTKGDMSILYTLQDQILPLCCILIGIVSCIVYKLDD